MVKKQVISRTLASMGG